MIRGHVENKCCEILCPGLWKPFCIEKVAVDRLNTNTLKENWTTLKYELTGNYFSQNHISMSTLRFTLFLTIILAVALSILSVVAPNHLVMSSKVTIQAQQTDVFPHLKNLESRLDWHPAYQACTPDQVRVLGREGAVDSKITWQCADGLFGSGEETITRVHEQKAVHTKISFQKPWSIDGTTTLQIREHRNKTTVSAVISAPLSFPRNVIQLVWDQTSVHQDALDKSLAILKKKVEAPLVPVAVTLVND